MPRRISQFVTFFLVCLIARSAIGDAPSTWVDDAQLHDVQFIGSKYAFAVGEHGAIWKSENGGRSWSRLDCGLDASLRSACFLTEQVGWVAGRVVNPYSNWDGSVLLSTQDGGRTWNQIDCPELPALSYVRFFDSDEGIVVGQPSSVAPSGIFKTTDGGENWRGVHGDAPQTWKASSFPQLERGAVAGVGGRVSLMGGDELFDSKLTVRGFRTIRAISLPSSGSGWLSGDGGLVLKTANMGIVWESPAADLPEGLRDCMDFRAAEVRGDKVWLAGAPGSVIWHTPDGGQHWSKQLTGQTAPISAVRFATDQIGMAVGSFGLILRTENGGKTWQASRAADRRAAILSIHARRSQVSAPLLMKLSGEMGYRSAVWVAQRDDLGPLAVGSDGESRVQSAVQRCGSDSADVHWQFPIAVPGVEYSTTKLTAEWQKLTEGRLAATMLGTLVRQIRIWRPNVIVIDQPSSDDAACQLLYDAVQQAATQAADPTRFVEQTELTGLAAWNADRIYMRLAPGASGDAHVELDELLPYLKTSARVATSPSTVMLQGGRLLQSETSEAGRIAYRLLEVERRSKVELASATRGGNPSASRGSDFFVGLSVLPGSAARREIGVLDEESLERLQSLVQRQRNVTAIAQKRLDDPKFAGQILGQLRPLVQGMEPAQAAVLLRDVADEHRKRSQYDLVEATYLELSRLYPREPATLDAIRWLIQFWCSSEVNWQRTRGILSKNSSTDRQTRAIDFAKRIERMEPNRFYSAEIQFPLASIRRTNGSVKLADTILRNFVAKVADPATKEVAQRELWTSFETDEVPQAFTLCYKVADRPYLDGVLSDSCWKDASEIRLTASTSGDATESSQSTAMVAYDDQFLYVAFTCPRTSGTSTDGPQQSGRKHDADLSRHDRITFRLDLDRDYSTWYEFHVDQRGWTAESCWDDPHWDPQWYVAADADQSDWRIEAAIPWAELSPAPPKRGAIYGLSILRTIPTVGLQSWAQPARSQPEPSIFGLLKFD